MHFEAPVIFQVVQQFQIWICSKKNPKNKEGEYLKYTDLIPHLMNFKFHAFVDM